MELNSNSSFVAIESAIRKTGARVTSARVQVLSTLQTGKTPLSHSDIEVLLRRQAHPEMDRVTLYRVLDWLVESGLAHKVANTRGVYCYTAADPDAEHKRHMHFRCNDCGQLICLDMPPPALPALPKDFLVTAFELDISGECPDCKHDQRLSVVRTESAAR